MPITNGKYTYLHYLLMNALFTALLASTMNAALETGLSTMTAAFEQQLL